jgi:uncharacterized RmlC-like cupin family protein
MQDSKIEENKAVVFLNYFNKDYEWKNFIDCISDGYNLEDDKNNTYPHKEVIGKINFWQKLTMTLDNIDSKNFPGIEDKVNKLAELHKSVGKSGICTGYFGVVSLTSKEPTTGRHDDPVDVIYCQFIGSVTWNIFYENAIETFLLNPGDVIYVPKLISHEVVSLSPRAAISFMFEAI